MKDKIFVSKWVGDFLAIGIFAVFFMTVVTAMFIAFFQVGANGDYAPEYTGILNNVIVYLLGVFSGVIGVLFGIKQEEMAKNIDQSAKVSKEVGAVYFAEEKEKSIDEEV